MIYIVAALYIEAKPLIDKYNLKKENSSPKFQIFSNEKIKLIISGVGRIKSSIALSQLSTNINIRGEDFIINLGFCASTSDKDSLADILMPNKILNAYSSQCFYPEMLYKHDFLEGTLICYDEIQYSIHKKFKERFYIDMESIGFFEAASYYFKREKIIILKIVSDILSYTKKERKFIDLNNSNFLLRAYERIFIFIEKLINFSQENEQNFNLLEENFIKKIRQNLKLSDTMYYEFLNLLRYLKLSKRDIFKFLKIYENIEIKNKLEGKKHFEDIKKRIID
ncbi:MAG: spore photoproduct lyase [Fusobacterium sp.]|uniref:spore photoproduct lyase n=1 Tax=Fusobacterium sp. TaxID=68766 RepID=UPI0026DCCA72|nr:spore photoproduct lyase [Fusobacterium sp.]MDO4690101.1 spore photoproduct lyase [Fusobacterium sp.]